MPRANLSCESHDATDIGKTRRLTRPDVAESFLASKGSLGKEVLHRRFQIIIVVAAVAADRLRQTGRILC